MSTFKTDRDFATAAVTLVAGLAVLVVVGGLAILTVEHVAVPRAPLIASPLATPQTTPNS